MDTRGLDLERAGSRRYGPRLRHSIADHQRMPSRIAMLGVVGNVLIHLGFERCYQHASGTLLHQRIQIQLECILLVLFRSNYAQPAAYLSLDGLSAVSGRQQPGGYAALRISAPIHNIRLYLTAQARIRLLRDGRLRRVPATAAALVSIRRS